MTSMNSQAIDAALNNDWHAAIKINRSILEKDPNHIDALNRLAYALSKTGAIEESIQTYDTILTKDTYNPIAKKNLEKIKNLKARSGQKIHTNGMHHAPISPAQFLADAQKTKTVKLINLAPREALQTICIGEQVAVAKRRFELQVKDAEDRYIGAFPDDIGHIFMRHLERGKKLTIYVKDIQENLVSVFVKY